MLRSTDIDECGGQDGHVHHCSVNDIGGEVGEEDIVGVGERDGNMECVCWIDVQVECAVHEIVWPGVSRETEWKANYYTPSMILNSRLHRKSIKRGECFDASTREAGWIKVVEDIVVGGQGVVIVDNGSRAAL